MARRATNHRNRSRVWRAATVGVSIVATVGFGVAGTVVHAEETPAEPDTAVPTIETETGVVDGAVVAVGLPPVPETSVVVAVGQPPVPDTSVEVAVGEPPVPPVTVPDAASAPEPENPAEATTTAPTAAPTNAPVSVASEAPVDVPDVPQAIDLELPKTGADEARATAIVAGAAVSVGAALRALARR